MPLFLTRNAGWCILVIFRFTVQTKHWLVDIMSHDNNNILSCDWCSVITWAMLGCDWCRAVTVETWAPLLPPRCRFWHLAQQTENRDHKHGIHWTRTRPSSLQWTQPFIFYKNRYLDILLVYMFIRTETEAVLRKHQILICLDHSPKHCNLQDAIVDRLMLRLSDRYSRCGCQLAE